MDEERFKNEELELQHYGFSAAQFASEFKEEVRNVAKATLDGIKLKLLEKGAVYEDVVNEEMEKLLGKYVSVRDEVMSTAEEEIYKFFAISKEVVSHLDWKQPYNIEGQLNMEDLEKEVKALEQEYRKEQAFQQLCGRELEKLNAIEPVLEKMDVILSKKLPADEKPMSSKTEKSLKLYDELISKITEDSPDVVKSVCKHNNLFA